MKVWLCVIMALLVTGCASKRNFDVIPMEGGFNVSRGYSGEKREAEQAALEEATGFCEYAGQKLEVIEMTAAYSGLWSESTHATVNTVGKVADAVLFLPVDIVSNGEYAAQVKFRCKSL